MIYFCYASSIFLPIYFFIESDSSSVLISDRRQLLLKKFESIQAENIDLKRQLKVIQKRLKDVYERDSHDKQGEVIY